MLAWSAITPSVETPATHPEMTMRDEMGERASVAGSA